MKIILAILLIGFTAVLFAQGEYEAEEFVNDNDLKFAVKQMQRSKYIGTAIACEEESPEICDSIDNLLFEKNKGKLQLPLNSFTFIQHYSIDSSAEMSAANPQINRLILDAKPGENVKAVFEGEVTSIFEIPGNEKVVMIKHGSYRMVYGSLTDVSVNVGDWIKSEQEIGKVTEYSQGKMIFEIWSSARGVNQAEKVEDWIELGQ